MTDGAKHVTRKPLAADDRGRAPDAGAFTVLLLTSSPLLHAEARQILGDAAVREFQFRCAAPHDHDLDRLIDEAAPRVVLVPFGGSSGTGIPAVRQQERDLRLIERLVSHWQAPVIALGNWSSAGEQERLVAGTEAIIAGAVSYLPHEQWAGETGRAVLCAKIQAAARVKVLRPLPPVQPLGQRGEGHSRPVAPARSGPTLDGPVAAIVIGASAGGPAALRELLSALSAPTPAPVLIVQHMPPTFAPQLAADLSRATSCQVVEARKGDLLAPGRVLLVPGRQMLVLAHDRIVDVVDMESKGIHGQAIDRTMHGVAAHYGARAIGVLLTGMGEDGVQGLKAIKARGGLTFGQDEASCFIYGMPRAAAEQGVVDRVASPAAIGAAISDLLARAAGGRDAAVTASG